MKKYLFIFFAILLTEVCSWSQQNITPRQLLDDAFVNLDSEDGWQCKAVGDDLKTIIDKYPNAPEKLTAVAMYVAYLVVQPGNNSPDIISFADTVLAKNPKSWQAIFCLLNEAILFGSQEKSQIAIDTAQKGLKLLDEVSIEQVADPDFDRLLKATHSSRSDIKDGFLFVMATRLINTGKKESADEYIKQIKGEKSHRNVQRLRELKVN